MPDVFEPEALLAVLNEHGVDYVVVGGLSALLQGSPLPTADIDVTPQRSPANLTRLSAALDELQATIRVDDLPDGLPFRHDARSLASVTVLNLRTKHGNLDLVLTPSGGLTYEDMAARRLTVGVNGVRVPLAHLDDVITSKTAADRSRDRAALPVLRELQRRLRERGEA